MNMPDPNYLDRFERGLNITDIDLSKLGAKILGYGEISTIFQIGDDHSRAYKRMPLFATRMAAEEYGDNYRHYCRFLEQAGLHLPEDELRIVERPGKTTVLYIVQQQLPAEWFLHRLVQRLDNNDFLAIVERLIPHLLQVWDFNAQNSGTVELALDAQISNWAVAEGDWQNGTIMYVDTSTPLFRLDGVEQLNPELILQSAPSFLRWIIRWLFLRDVMERYYDRRKILIDLTANFYKEQRQDLIPAVVDIVNRNISEAFEPLTEKEVSSYYREDKVIWSVFLNFRRLDRWLKNHFTANGYDFILPGKIKR